MISPTTEQQIRDEWQRKADCINQGFTIEFDEYSLEQTAKVLSVINPGRSSVDHIKDMVRANMWDGSTSLGTAGWEATGFFPDHKPNTMVVRLSVSAYTVQRWLDAHNSTPLELEL